MKKLLIATRSRGKFPEIVSELNGLPFEFVSLNDVSEVPSNFEAEETESTLEGNAVLKATTFGKKAELLTLAEDTGLEVDALGGRPGVYAARYAPGTDEDRYRKLLNELKDVPEGKCTACFRTVVAIYNPKNDTTKICEGIYEGRIAVKPKGSNGFGYDPIFYNVELGKTNAEMTREEKNKVSHRGKALRKAKEILKQNFL